MNNIVELNKILELPDEILKNSSSARYTSLLSENITNTYYDSSLRNKVDKIIDIYNDAKFVYNFADECTISSINPFFDIKTVSTINNNNNKVLSTITKNVDLQIYISNIYNKMIDLSYKFTYEEGVYFIDIFFSKNSEEEISEKLNICRQTLQKIKKSCLVKCYLELKYNDKGIS